MIGVVGLLEHVKRHTRTPFQNPQRILLALGGAEPAMAEFPVTFGSSQYAQTILTTLWGLPPSLDLDYERRVQACCRRLVSEGRVESAHDVSDGGLAVALAECCLGQGVGAMVELAATSDLLRWLFAEDPSRILVTVAENQVAEAQRIAAEYKVQAEAIGITGGRTLRVSQPGAPLFEVPVSELRLAYETALERAVEKVI